MDAHSTDGTGRTGTDGTDTDGGTDGRTDVAGEGGRAGDIVSLGNREQCAQKASACSADISVTSDLPCSTNITHCR